MTRLLEKHRNSNNSNNRNNSHTSTNRKKSKIMAIIGIIGTVIIVRMIVVMRVKEVIIFVAARKPMVVDSGLGDSQRACWFILLSERHLRRL